MKIEKHICVKQTYNNQLMGVECWSDSRRIFFMDRKSWVILGDIVELERRENGFIRRVWVNGELKTEDNFVDAHIEMFNRIRAKLKNNKSEDISDTEKTKLIAYVYKGEVRHANKEWTVEHCRKVFKRLGVTYWEILH